MLVDMVCSV